MRIQNLGVNLVGRDFVCGDIHGSYSCLMAFLSGVNFNPLTDRLICAGDLVDRGPENEKCLELMLEPWFFMTKGNHEELMEDFFGGRPMGNWWHPNGGDWGVQYTTEQSDEAQRIREIVNERITNLPYLITVDKPDGSKFHVLHAEIVSRKPLSDADLADPEMFERLARQRTSNGHSVTWGRYIFNRMYRIKFDETAIRKINTWSKLEKMDVMFGPDLGMIYSGHTPVTQPVQFFGQTNLDTMAFGSYRLDASGWEGLTVTEPLTGKFWFANDNEFRETHPVIFTSEKE